MQTPPSELIFNMKHYPRLYYIYIFAECNTRYMNFAGFDQPPRIEAPQVSG